MRTPSSSEQKKCNPNPKPTKKFKKERAETRKRMESINKNESNVWWQRAKKVVSDSPRLVDFAIGLVIFVLNLPDGQVLFFGEIQITEGL